MTEAVSLLCLWAEVFQCQGAGRPQASSLSSLCSGLRLFQWGEERSPCCVFKGVRVDILMVLPRMGCTGEGGWDAVQWS